MNARTPGPRLRSSRSAHDLLPLGRAAAGCGRRRCRRRGGGGGHLRYRPPIRCRGRGRRRGGRGAGGGQLGLGALGVLGGEQLPDPLAQRLELGQLTAGAAAGPGQVDVDDLLDPPGAVGDDGDPVGQGDRLVDAVGDEDDRLAGGRDDLGQLLLHDLAGHRVDRGEGLVHQQQAGLGDERAGEADALAHATGELAGIGPLEAGEAHHLDVLRDLGAGVGVDAALHLQAEADVLLDGAPGHQRVVLEDDGAVGAGAGDRLAVDRDLAGGRLDEAGDDVEERALAAAAGAHDREELALAHFEVEVLQAISVLFSRVRSYFDRDPARLDGDRPRPVVLLCWHLHRLPRPLRAPRAGFTGLTTAIVAIDCLWGSVSSGAARCVKDYSRIATESSPTGPFRYVVAPVVTHRT